MKIFGFAPRESAFLRRLTPEWRIQKFLDDIAYDLAGASSRSPRRVLRERSAQCLDGALFAAAALRLQGEDDLWEIGAHLVRVRHFALLTPAMRRDLGPVDRRLFEAGKLGRKTV